MIQMNAEELAMDHIEHANLIRSEMSMTSDANLDEEIGDEEMWHVIKMAEEMALHYRTAMLLRNLVQALTTCPECGTDLGRYYRPSKSSSKRTR